jgi:hypothetical protein
VVDICANYLKNYSMHDKVTDRTRVLCKWGAQTDGQTDKLTGHKKADLLWSSIFFKDTSNIALLVRNLGQTIDSEISVYT